MLGLYAVLLESETLNDDVVHITIDGSPVAGARPRFRNIHKRDGTSFVSAYNPAHMQKYQSDARYIAQQQMEGRPPFDGALSVTLNIHLPIPSSFSKKKAYSAMRGSIRPTSRPDLDNYIKQLDAFTGLIWRDDSQIVHLCATKLYSEKPCMELFIEEIAAVSHAPKEQAGLFTDPDFREVERL